MRKLFSSKVGSGRMIVIASVISASFFVLFGLIAFLGIDDKTTLNVSVDEELYELTIPGRYIKYVTRYDDSMVGNIVLVIDIREFGHLVYDIGILPDFELRMSIQIQSTPSSHEEMTRSHVSRKEYSKIMFKSDNFIVRGSERLAKQYHEIYRNLERMLILYGNFDQNYYVESYITCWPRLFKSLESGRCEAFLKTTEGINVSFYITFSRTQEIQTYSNLVRRIVGSFIKSKPGDETW